MNDEPTRPLVHPLVDGSIPPEDHVCRLRAARARAEWELGDETWADVIIGAYLAPDHDEEVLRLEKDD